MSSSLKKLCKYSGNEISLQALLQIVPRHRITLANRAGIKLFCDSKTMNQLQTSMSDIWQELAAFPVNAENLSTFVNIDAKRRAIMGLCTSEEWLEICKDSEAVRQIIDCRTGRNLNFR